MTLNVGTHLGPFEITGTLGEREHGRLVSCPLRASCVEPSPWPVALIVATGCCSIRAPQVPHRAARWNRRV